MIILVIFPSWQRTKLSNLRALSFSLVQKLRQCGPCCDEDEELASSSEAVLLILIEDAGMRNPAAFCLFKGDSHFKFPEESLEV